MAGLTDNNMKSGIRTGADENNPSLFFIAAGLVFYRVKWYNKNVCGAKTAFVEEFTDSVKYLTCTDNFCIIDLFMELFFV